MSDRSPSLTGAPARTTGAAPAEREPVEPAEIKAVPLRRPGRWVGTAVVAVLIAVLVKSLLTNPNYEWDVVGRYFLDESILRGLLLTLELTAVSMAAGILLGIVLAVMRGSPNPILAQASAVYIWFFRGTPLLVQLIFWFNLSALYPELTLGIPFGPQFVEVDANALITPLMAAFLGLALNEAAYMAEIVRAGIVSVQPGQHQAAAALGMTRLQTMRRIVLPQAMRVIIPPTGNQTIAMLKTSSLVSVLAIPELLYTRADHLQPHLRDDPAAARREHLVPDRDVDPDGDPGAHRAPLLARQPGARRAVPSRGCGGT